jgi:hypothetical protein
MAMGLCRTLRSAEHRHITGILMKTGQMVLVRLGMILESRATSNRPSSVRTCVIVGMGDSTYMVRTARNRALPSATRS